jgi:BirA family biotin operon repressor/biotin-[acetyl-CoA-carboxylase] ligase
MVGYDWEAMREEWGQRLHSFEELDSTNEQALKLGREGAGHGSVVVAERQLAGRGRRGAAWLSGEGSGLAFTVLLRPQMERALWPRLSLVAGVAVARSIERVGLSPEIKWPNDVLVAGRKVCGILVEAEGDFVVVGIGLNVGKMELPGELQETATSLATEGATQKRREEYLSEIVADFLSLTKLVEREFTIIVQMVRSRCALVGHEIEFLEGQEEGRGLCEGVGEGGELLVRVEGNLKRYFAADRIRVLKR